MLEVEVVEPIESEWVSFILFAPEKDGMFLFIVDYRKLSPLTVRDFNPIPCMAECITRWETRQFSWT